MKTPHAATPGHPGPARFPRTARVRTGAEYAHVFEGARRTADPALGLHWLATGTPPRLGLAVSRKVDPNAVGRNRIKRVFRDQFRKLRAQLPDGDYVIVARAAARTLDNPQLRQAMLRTLVRAGALPASAVAVTMPPAKDSDPSIPRDTPAPAPRTG